MNDNNGVLEMLKFREMLDEMQIEWTDTSTIYDDPEMRKYSIHRTHFTYKGNFWSVIYGFGTYGSNDGLLEVMSSAINGGEPVGWCTAEKVISFMKEGDK